ncbi:RICIN domain-containing protein [Phycicoccus flavus]|uniref:RICIN domain-containing protein n=1 Tax=Phycicoccus flavus TaxID=2502783 RepID=UPI000FEBF855|nr:RICIN domain-containing protein [Phycicoccus flavus]NHA66451.1 ricin-type beta-trefoil lectin domain protein [Phycicoccus flavus]
MRWSPRRGVLAVVTAALLVAAGPLLAAQAFGPNVLYAPNPGDCRRVSCVTYVKSAQLPSGKIVASFEDDSQDYNGQVWPIWSSTDDGRSWSRTSEVPDTHRGWGNWTNPFFYVLPQPIGGMPAGTLLLAGISAPPDRSRTAVEIYKSTDEGVTWSFLSEVAVGGAENGTPVWEPYLLVAGGKLICYYSDERDKARHNQKLVHQVSTDGVSWGPVVEDVALADSRLRPGMPVVTRMANGQYIMTFEVVGAPGVPNNFKISADPESWSPKKVGTTIDYGGSPVITTLPNGRLAYNSYDSGDIRINTGNGTGPWTKVGTNMPVGYSRMMQYVRGTGRMLVLSVDGFWSSTTNVVRAGDVDLGYSTGPYYTLVNVKSAKVLDASQASLQDGGSVIQWTNTGAANQQWHVSDVGGGYRAILNRNSGRAVSIEAGSTADGAPAIQWVENNGDDQDWQLVPSGSSYKLVNRQSGKLLTVSQGSTSDGAAVVQWPDRGLTEQLWTLVPVS